MSLPQASTSSSRVRERMWVIAQFGTIALVLGTGAVWSGHWERFPSIYVARGLLILSGIIALGGFWALGRNLTANPQPRPGGRLVQNGIYAFIRHPLYCSLILGGFGWALLWQSLPSLALALVLALVLDGKAKAEEQFLRVRFPEYEAYCERVRRFCPRIY